uniref:dynein axonemal assembly factor 11-like isoform X2 n=1 Tax=Myxine glutinosa TaxID=7769 RepID=UPI00358DE840
MVRITEKLVRSRAEHNEGDIFSLEELSLHQQEIERLEYIGNWCLNLQILYLQNNLVPRIENINKLKKLQYLNLALNNIERIENLQGCEDLQKLDLTLNFVGELSSVRSLCHSLHLEELYLVGNPCALFEGYRAFVVATLPRLKVLDGQAIERSERIRALQDIEKVTMRVEEQEREHKKRRERERTEGEKRKKDREHKKADMEKQRDANDRSVTMDEEEERQFWREETPFTPESRLEAHSFVEERREARGSGREQQKTGKVQARSLVRADGRILNINEPRFDFRLAEADDGSSFTLDLALYRYLDTSLVDVDVQPKCIRVEVKNKTFQLVLPDEVSPDSSVARRSQTTGHLEVTMPRVGVILKPRPHGGPSRQACDHLPRKATPIEEGSCAYRTHLPSPARRSNVDMTFKDDNDEVPPLI